MPHLVLEYSANLQALPDLGLVLRRLHEALAASGPFEIEKMKSRAVRHATFHVADGAPDRAFVHLTAAVLAGRDKAVLDTTAAALLAVLQAEFAPCRAGRRVDLTLELREMPRALYFKAGPAGGSRGTGVPVP